MGGKNEIYISGGRFIEGKAIKNSLSCMCASAGMDFLAPCRLRMSYGGAELNQVDDF